MVREGTAGGTVVSGEREITHAEGVTGMANGWFQRKLGAASKRSLQAKVEAIPDGLWEQCPGCRELVFSRELERSLKVCKKCNYHFRLTASERLLLLLDPGSFVEWDAHLRTVDPLHFPN